MNHTSVHITLFWLGVIIFSFVLLATLSGCAEEGPSPGTPLSSVEVCFDDVDDYSCLSKTIEKGIYVKDGKATGTEFIPGRCYVMTTDFFVGREVGDQLTFYWNWVYADGSSSLTQSYSFQASDSAVSVTIPCFVEQ